MLFACLTKNAQALPALSRAPNTLPSPDNFCIPAFQTFKAGLKCKTGLKREDQHGFVLKFHRDGMMLGCREHLDLFHGPAPYPGKFDELAAWKLSFDHLLSRLNTLRL